jgi:hypothetical protein
MPANENGPSFTYVFEALKVRWNQTNLATHIPGGITRDHPHERTERTYVVARLVTEYTKSSTNKGRYDHVDFELTACADTPEESSTAIAYVIEALRTPMQMNQDARMVKLWLSDVKSAQELQKGRTAQGFSCLVARSRFNP